jgi:hypothetical protein
MLGWDRYGFDKKCTGTHDTDLVFSHLVGSVGHVVHSGSPGTRIVNALFFILGWAWCVFHKKSIGKHYAELVFLHPVGSVGNVVHSGMSGMRNVNTPFFHSGMSLLCGNQSKVHR